MSSILPTGAEIKARREKLGARVEDCASRAGLTGFTWWRVERTGKGHVSTLERMIETLAALECEKAGGAARTTPERSP